MRRWWRPLVCGSAGLQIPARVRAAIEAIIGGGAVVTAVSQSGGFSPGTADRVVTADGRRAFVKAVSSTQNEQSPSLHRAEAHVVDPTPTKFLRAGAARHLRQQCVGRAGV